VALPCLRQYQNSVFAAERSEPQFQTIVQNIHFPN